MQVFFKNSKAIWFSKLEFCTNSDTIYIGILGELNPRQKKPDGYLILLKYLG